MADSKAAEQSAAQKSESKTAAAAPQPRQGNSGQSQEPGEGLGAALDAQHKARTEVPGHPGIDARLDNRAGAARPPLEEFPAKPQQVDGPDVIHQVEHTRRTLDGVVEGDDVPRKGMFSAGPHGLSDESLREGDTTFGTEGLTQSEAAKGPKGA